MPIRATPASQSTMFNGPTRSALPVSLVVEARPDSVLDRGGVGLTGRRLHDLSDEEADGLRLARPVVRERGIDGGGHLATVRDLVEAALGDDRRRGPTGGGVRLQDLAALCPRDGAG